MRVLRHTFQAQRALLVDSDPRELQVAMVHTMSQGSVSQTKMEISKQKEKVDQALDEALKATFPASDPIALYYPKK